MMNSLRRPPPLVLLLLAVVLILGASGVAYTLWSETLHLEGTVETGEVKAEWSFVGCYDFEEKDVGTTHGWIDPADPRKLHFAIANGYPQYVGGCEVEYTVLGTIPVHVESIDVVPGDGLTNCEVEQSPTTGTTTVTCDQLVIRFVDGLCAQLHPGDEASSSLRVTVLQPAEQNATYEFRTTVQLNQYNESSCP